MSSLPQRIPKKKGKFECLYFMGVSQKSVEFDTSYTGDKHKPGEKNETKHGPAELRIFMELESEA